MVVPVSEVASPIVERAERIAALVALAPRVAVAADLEVERLRQRVHDRDADPVQAARDLVALAAELPAGVELGQDDLGRRQPEARPSPRPGSRGRCRSTVTRPSGARVTRDVVAVTLERFVDAVVDHLVDKMVESAGAGGADVHAGPLANRLEALENGDVFGVVAGFGQTKTRLNRRKNACNYQRSLDPTTQGAPEPAAEARHRMCHEVGVRRRTSPTLESKPRRMAGGRAAALAGLEDSAGRSPSPGSPAARELRGATPSTHHASPDSRAG